MRVQDVIYDLEVLHVHSRLVAYKLPIYFDVDIDSISIIIVTLILYLSHTYEGHDFSLLSSARFSCTRRPLD